MIYWQTPPLIPMIIPGNPTCKLSSSVDSEEIKGVGVERRVVRVEEREVMATDVHKLRRDLIAATTDIHRKMTKKYQIEF